MESALTPREVQARVRAGASLDEVARLAGVPPEKVAPFAEPVLAERDHVAGIALSSPVRRHGEASGHMALGEAIRQRLTASGIDPDQVTWDTWRMPNRRWVLRAVWVHEPTTDETTGNAPADADEAAVDKVTTDDRTVEDTKVGSTGHGDEQTDDSEETPESGSEEILEAEEPDSLTTAEFHFDLMARFSVAANPWASWLIDDGPNPDANEDSDQLAIIRALGDDFEAASPPGADAPVPGPGEGTPTAPPSTVSDAEPRSFDLPRSIVTPQEIGEEVEADMDQALSLAPGGSSDLDVLYDMLGGIAEDSVNIYANLDPDARRSSTTRSARSSLHDEVDDTTSFENEATERLAEELRQLRNKPPQESASATTPVISPESKQTNGPESGAKAAVSDKDPESAEEAKQTKEAEQTTEAEPGTKKPRKRTDRRKPEPEQPSLMGDDEPAKPAPRKRKRRAQVPSWDEIMFGSPPKRDD